MAQAPEVVVVGAGIVGASIAWHLTAAGAAVTVIDAVEPGGIATAGSFAWINASWGNPEHYFRLRMHSMAGWRRLAEAVPAVPIAWVGGLCWDQCHTGPKRIRAGHASSSGHCADGMGRARPGQTKALSQGRVRDRFAESRTPNATAPRS